MPRSGRSRTGARPGAARVPHPHAAVLPRPVNVLSTHSGVADGLARAGLQRLLSGAGSVIADLQVELCRAVQANELVAARAVNERIYPMTRAFYASPFLDMHNRMKEALVLLGRMPRAVVRPPLDEAAASRDRAPARGDRGGEAHGRGRARSGGLTPTRPGAAGACLALQIAAISVEGQPRQPAGAARIPRASGGGTERTTWLRESCIMNFSRRPARFGGRPCGRAAWGRGARGRGARDRGARVRGQGET